MSKGADHGNATHGHARHLSHGALALLEIIQDIFPNQIIEYEYHIGNQLRLDYFLPRLGIAFEFDGEAHFNYIEHFHGDRKGFIRAQRRDRDKDERCEEEGIVLIRVAYDEPMTRENVLAKIEEALA